MQPRTFAGLKKANTRHIELYSTGQASSMGRNQHAIVIDYLTKAACHTWPATPIALRQTMLSAFRRPGYGTNLLLPIDDMKIIL